MTNCDDVYDNDDEDASLKTKISTQFCHDSSNNITTNKIITISAALKMSGDNEKRNKMDKKQSDRISTGNNNDNEKVDNNTNDEKKEKKRNKKKTSKREDRRKKSAKKREKEKGCVTMVLQKISIDEGEASSPLKRRRLIVSSSTDDDDDDDTSTDFRYPTTFRASVLKLLRDPESWVTTAGVGIVARMAGDVDELFKETDTDGNGLLDMTELGRLFEKLEYNISEAELAQVMKELDTTNDGRVSHFELCSKFTTARLTVPSEQ